MRCSIFKAGGAMNYSYLNENQIKAVKQIEGPLLILAGAGSGKTSTMTSRIAYMLECGVKPYNILAVTFTNKAANEMKNRVINLTGEDKGLWIMTFHSMCLRILRYHSDRIGYKPGFVVYDDSDKKTALRSVIKSNNLDDKIYSVAYLSKIISSCKEKSMTPEEYLKENDGYDVRSKKVYLAFKSYNELLRKNNAMDFDDLLLNCVKLLENEDDVLSYYQNRFKYIMVDEYQDTNYLQYKIIQYLSQAYRNLCVVGDDDQCIYEWRGADIRNILDFEKDFPEALVIKLEQNYRSDNNILNLANSVIKNNMGRKRKTLWSNKELGDKITYARLDDEKAEARYIANEICKLKGKGYEYKDIAILYRKNILSRSFEECFPHYNIPYRVLAGLRYYDKKEIKDMLSYMRLIENPDDDFAFERIINEPKRGIGKTTVEKIKELAKHSNMSCFETLKNEDILNKLTKKSKPLAVEFIELIETCREQIGEISLEDLYDNLLIKTGYLKTLEMQNTIEADTRVENIMEFKSVIASFQGKSEEYLADDEMINSNIEASERTELGLFLENITLTAEIDNHDEKEDAVVLMTMHSAKGLEFPIVFIPGMENGVFPGNNSFDKDKIEEERRLCYVGITRAKKKLYLTSVIERMLYGRRDYMRESMFLEEMDRNLMDGDRLDKEGHNKYLKPDDGYYGETPKKPFDALKYAKNNVKEKAFNNDNLKKGDKVRHQKFGIGLIIETDNKTLTIMFDDYGRKKIGKGFVKLDKVGD